MSIPQHLGGNNYHNFIPQTPSISIVDQPKQRGLRFRYKCEGRSAGSIPGEKSSTEKKTYPSIKIHNYDGPSAIVVVSCVTKDIPHLPHPHNLVGQDCKDGVCTVKIKNPHDEISFPNIGIQCCKRHDVEENLKTRENIRVNPFGTGYPSSTGNIDLNTVRLCFQVFLPDKNKKFNIIVPPVVSNAIIDKKSVHDLVICRLSKQSGCVSGGEEVFLLCEKINKDDIKVRFYQHLPNGVSWEAEGDFTHNDVHRQYAIVFKTPPYRDLSIQDATTVFIQLYRPSDDEVGDPKPFQYIPQDSDPYCLNMKKRKKITFQNIIPNQIPMTVMDEYNKDDQDQEVSDCSNGSSFVKDKLKKKIERKIPDSTNFNLNNLSNPVPDIPTFNLNNQSLVQPSLADVITVQKALNLRHNLSNNQDPNQNIIHLYDTSFTNYNQFTHNNVHEGDTKNIILSPAQLHNKPVVLNNRANNGNEIFNYNNHIVYSINSNNNVYNNETNSFNNNTFNMDNNRIVVGAHEIICSPTTTTLVSVTDVVTEGVRDSVVGDFKKS